MINKTILRKNIFNKKSIVLSDIFKNENNISLWNRELDRAISLGAKEIINDNLEFNFSKVLKYDEINETLVSRLGQSQNKIFLFNDISNLTELFCNMFELKNVWLRMGISTKATCPRFHVDYLKCRLLTTYYGPGTEWLPNELIDRSKLKFNQKSSTDQDGLFSSKTHIKQLATGDVALLKGELWSGNKGQGLVHRSPYYKQKYRRLYLTIDFSDLNNQ